MNRISCFLLLSLGSVLFACGGEADGASDADGAGGQPGTGGSAHGTVGSGGSADGTGGSGGAPSQNLDGWTACPSTFDPLDGGAEEFAAYAGEYGVTWDEAVSLTGGDCGFDGLEFVEGKQYSLKISTSAPQLSLETEGETWTKTWDGEFDLACAGQTTAGIEVDDGTSFARLIVVNGEAHQLVLGLCTGELQEL
ncbi:MAG TPA: hypothetical protein VLC09_02985 [Polyangiaceae bacterium]|nr:hypothetical protein [Polyangiaceae bacterium]